MMKPLPSSGISTSIIPSNQKYSSIVLNSNHFYLSANIGVEKLIAWLNGNNIKYVVLRFFERLPNLHRKGGDIDLLVADEDEEMVKAFLADNASDKSGLFLGVWTPSRANYRKNLTSLFFRITLSALARWKECYIYSTYSIMLIV